MLEWNVYYQDFNKKKIIPFNVFQHASFKNRVEQLLDEYQEDKSFVKFSEELKYLAQYYFWAKCEYEVVVTSWPPRITNAELNRLWSEEDIYRYAPRLDVSEKIDIYDQLCMNWEQFAKYVWTYNCDKIEKKNSIDVELKFTNKELTKKYLGLEKELKSLKKKLGYTKENN